MKIAYTVQVTELNSKTDHSYIRTEHLFYYDEEKDKINTIDNRPWANKAHGVGSKKRNIWIYF